MNLDKKLGGILSELGLKDRPREGKNESDLVKLQEQASEEATADFHSLGQSDLEIKLKAALGSSNLIYYVALKSWELGTTRTDFVYGASLIESELLPRVRKEVLTLEQNRELDRKLDEIARQVSYDLIHKANNADITVQELLKSKSDLLNQQQRNAMKFVNGKYLEQIDVFPESEDQLRTELEKIRDEYKSTLREKNAADAEYRAGKVEDSTQIKELWDIMEEQQRKIAIIKQKLIKLRASKNK